MFPSDPDSPIWLMLFIGVPVVIVLAGLVIWSLIFNIFGAGF